MEYVHGGDIYTYGDVLDFSVNVNPYGPSEEVLEAAKRSMDEVSLYPDSQCRRLRKRLAEKKSLPEEYFLFGNGAARSAGHIIKYTGNAYGVRHRFEMTVHTLVVCLVIIR